MRTLVAAACVAVLAFVGYFFWQERADADSRAVAERRIECRTFLNALASGDTEPDEARLKACMFDGSISEGDVERAAEKIGAGIPPGWR